MAPLRAYQWLVSPLTLPACRFEPSCSAYGLEALERHGALRGLVLIVWRLVRCQPLCRAGFDPVPERLVEAFTFARFVPWPSITDADADADADAQEPNADEPPAHVAHCLSSGPVHSGPTHTGHTFPNPAPPADPAPHRMPRACDASGGAGACPPTP